MYPCCKGQCFSGDSSLLKMQLYINGEGYIKCHLLESASELRVRVQHTNVRVFIICNVTQNKQNA